ncbi:uncharacterized protein LOC104889416 isoform X1 [Beta vulgaris subsp. vulgaris]|uniref:uncharacterized protein LOC104889416 isoform X1 n=1 Tax=Beta vulgaris subsp. vulgaris TaxID=3555 RepID=UPI0020368ACC|nr:uncharacterized protein LOC104889416 isoform X1 [Beta vulgaris subsp. vulgaris]
MEETVLFIDDLDTSSYYYCRICHEAEFESCRKLEAPCSCSGTVKFAHRDCIQRWCDEKGDIICELCLQKYEPGYTAIPKQPKKIVVLDEVVSIRGSLEIPRTEQAPQNPDLLAIAECSSEAERSASCCRTVALIFTFLLLMRHMLDVLLGGAEYHPFSILTVLILRGCGVIIPMYVIIQTISALQNSIKRNRILHENFMLNTNGVRVADIEEQVHQR